VTEAHSDAGPTPAGRNSAILVRREKTTGDILGMADAAGILTAPGGRTSHAAVVARQLGKVYLVGCADLSSDHGDRTRYIGQQVLAEGDWFTLDGNAGLIYAGRLQTLVERPERELAKIRQWGECKGPPLEGGGSATARSRRLMLPGNAFARRTARAPCAAPP
jgi:phosphoenolpyruvate synthase/pyruvate phosphate dikinase